MALKTLFGDVLGQVSQVLGGRGAVGPVILVDEKNAPGEALGPRIVSDDMRPCEWILWRVQRKPASG